MHLRRQFAQHQRLHQRLHCCNTISHTLHAAQIGMQNAYLHHLLRRTSQNRTMSFIHPAISHWTGRRKPQTPRVSTSITSEECPARYCPGGYHPVQIDEIFKDRFKVLSKLGYGVYSTVWLAQDLSSASPSHVALKILTADSHGGQHPTFELDILRHLARAEGSHQGSKHVVRLLDDFVHKGPNGKHLCLAMELMGQSVASLQRQVPNKQVTVSVARSMATQILQALSWLHDTCHVVHTDLKPDNILVELSAGESAVEAHLSTLNERAITSNEDPFLTSQPIIQDQSLPDETLHFKLADFGVASWKDKHLTEWIQPPSLRAPEVFLNAPWGDKVDIWSLACVVYELLQGRVLFRGRPGPKDTWTAEEDQLAQMIELLGPMPGTLLKRGAKTRLYFDNQGRLLHIKELYPYSLRDLLKQTKNGTISINDYAQFEDFLTGLLKLDSEQRSSAASILGHAWLKG